MSAAFYCSPPKKMAPKAPKTNYLHVSALMLSLFNYFPCILFRFCRRKKWTVVYCGIQAYRGNGDVKISYHYLLQKLQQDQVCLSTARCHRMPRDATGHCPQNSFNAV